MFRTRLAALVVAGSLSFAGGCTGFGNPFCNCNSGCCSSPPPAPCCSSGGGCGGCSGCGGGEMVGSSPVAGPILVPQTGVSMEPPGTVLVTPTPTPARLQPVPQSVPIPAMPSSMTR